MVRCFMAFYATKVKLDEKGFALARKDGVKAKPFTYIGGAWCLQQHGIFSRLVCVFNTIPSFKPKKRGCLSSPCIIFIL